LQWSALRYPRPVRFSCLMLVFAASVRALVTPVIRKTSISVHHAWSTSSGVASFSNCRINKAGTYTLTATSGSLTADVSNTFTIN